MSIPMAEVDKENAEKKEKWENTTPRPFPCILFEGSAGFFFALSVSEESLVISMQKGSRFA